jgi:hypothetical protein
VEPGKLPFAMAVKPPSGLFRGRPKTDGLSSPPSPPILPGQVKE